jgi:hypothetical protein
MSAPFLPKGDRGSLRGGLRSAGSGQAAEEIAAADDPDESPPSPRALDHGNTAHALPGHLLDHCTQRVGWLDKRGAMSHDVANLGHRRRRARSVSGQAAEALLGDEADQVALGIHDRDGVEAVAVEQFTHRPHRVVRMNDRRVGRHHVPDDWFGRVGLFHCPTTAFILAGRDYDPVSNTRRYRFVLGRVPGRGDRGRRRCPAADLRLSGSPFWKSGRLSTTRLVVEALQAPITRLIWFERSAHNVPFEESHVSNVTVVRELQSIGVRPGAARGVRQLE